MVEIMSGLPAGSLKTQEVNLIPARGDFHFRSKSDQGIWEGWAAHRVDRIASSSWDHTKKKWTRAVRVMVLLEYLGNPGAKDILKDMNTGHPDAYPTKVAKEALKGLNS